MNFRGNCRPRFEGNCNYQNNGHSEGAWCNAGWDQQQDFMMNQLTPEKQFNRRTQCFDNNRSNYNSSSWTGFQNEDNFYNQSNFHNRNQSQEIYGRNDCSPYRSNNIQFNPYQSPNRTFYRGRGRGREKFSAKKYRLSVTPTKSDTESKKVSVNSSDCDRPKGFSKKWKSGEEMFKNANCTDSVEDVNLKDKDESMQISQNCKNLNNDSTTINLGNEQKKTENGKTYSNDAYRRSRLDNKDREKENSDYYKRKSPYEKAGSNYKYNNDLLRKRSFRPQKYSRSRSRSRSDSSDRRGRSRSHERIRKSLLSSRSRSRDRSRCTYSRDKRYRSGDKYTANRSDSNEDNKNADNQSRQKNNKDRYSSERMKERRNLQRERQDENIEKLKQSSDGTTDKPKKRTMLLSERFANLMDQNGTTKKSEIEKTASFKSDNFIEDHKCKETGKSALRKESVDKSKAMDVPAAKKLKKDDSDNLCKVGIDLNNTASDHTSPTSVGNKTHTDVSSTNVGNTSARRKSTDRVSSQNNSQIQKKSQKQINSPQENIRSEDIKLQKEHKIHHKNISETNNTSCELTVEREKKLHKGKNLQYENHLVIPKSSDKTQCSYQPVDNDTLTSKIQVNNTSAKNVSDTHVSITSDKDINDIHVNITPDKDINDIHVNITPDKDVDDIHVNITPDKDVDDIHVNITPDKDVDDIHVNITPDKDVDDIHVNITPDKDVDDIHVNITPDKDVDDIHVNITPDKDVDDIHVNITPDKDVDDIHVNITPDKDVDDARVSTSKKNIGDTRIVITSDKNVGDTQVIITSDKDIGDTPDKNVDDIHVNTSHKVVSDTQVNTSKKDVSDTQVFTQDKNVSDTRVIITSDQNTSGSSADLDMALEDLVEVYSPTSESDLDHSIDAVQPEKQLNDSKINKSITKQQQGNNTHCIITKQKKEFLEPIEKVIKIRTMSEGSLHECMENLNTQRTPSGELFVVDNCLDDDIADGGNENEQEKKSKVTVSENQKDGQNDTNIKSVLQSCLDSVTQEVTSSSEEFSTCKDGNETGKMNNVEQPTHLDKCLSLQKPCQPLQQPCQSLQQPCQTLQQSYQPLQLHSNAESVDRKLSDNCNKTHAAVSDKSECLTDKNDIISDVMDVSMCDESSGIPLNELNTLPLKQSGFTSSITDNVLSNKTENVSSDRMDAMPVNKNDIFPFENTDAMSPNKTDIEKPDTSENSQIAKDRKQIKDSIESLNISVDSKSDSLKSSSSQSATQNADKREKNDMKIAVSDMKKKTEKSKTPLDSGKTKPNEISHNQDLECFRENSKDVEEMESTETENMSDVLMEQPKASDKSTHLNKKTGTTDKIHKTKHSEKLEHLKKKAGTREKDDKKIHSEKNGTKEKSYKTKHNEKSEYFNKKDGKREKEHKGNHVEKREQSNNSGRTKQQGFVRSPQVNDQCGEKVKRSLKLNRPQKGTGVVEQMKNSEATVGKETMKNEHFSVSRKDVMNPYTTNRDTSENIKLERGNKQKLAFVGEATETVESEVDETLPKLVCSSRKTARAHLKKLKTTNAAGTTSMIKTSTEKDETSSTKKTIKVTKKVKTNKPLKENLKGCYPVLFMPDTACHISKKGGKIIEDCDTSTHSKPMSKEYTDSKTASDKNNSLPLSVDRYLERDNDCTSTSEMSDSCENSLPLSPNKSRSISEGKNSCHLSEKHNGKHMAKLVSISPSGKPVEIIDEKEKTSRSLDRNIFDNFGGMKRKCYGAENSTDSIKKPKLSSKKNHSLSSTSSMNKSVTKKVDFKQKSYKKLSKYLSNAEYFRFKRGNCNQADSKTKPVTQNDDMRNSEKNENNNSKNGKLDHPLKSREVDDSDITIWKTSEVNRNNINKSENSKEIMSSGSIVSENFNTFSSCTVTQNAPKLDKSHQMSNKEDLMSQTSNSSMEKNQISVESESRKSSTEEVMEETTKSVNVCNTEETTDNVQNNDTISDSAGDKSIGVIQRLMTNIDGKIELFNTSGESTIFHCSRRITSSRRNSNCDEIENESSVSSEQSCDKITNPAHVRSDSAASSEEDRLTVATKASESSSTNEMKDSEQSKNLDSGVSEHSGAAVCSKSEATEIPVGVSGYGRSLNFQKKVSKKIETNEIIENKQESSNSLKMPEQDEKEKRTTDGGSSELNLFGLEDDDSQMSSSTDAFLDSKTGRTEFSFTENDQDSRSSFINDILKTKLLASGKPLYEDITDVETDEDSSNLVIDLDMLNSHSSPVRSPTKSSLSVSSNQTSPNTTGVSCDVVNDVSTIMPENVEDDAINNDKESTDISEKGDDTLNKTTTLDVSCHGDTDNSLSDRTIAYGKSSSEDDENGSSDMDKNNLELQYNSHEKNKLTESETLTKDNTLEWLSETSEKVQESVCEKSLNNDSFSDDDSDDPEEDCNIIGCFVRGVPQSPWTPMPATPATPYKPEMEEEDQNVEFPAPQLPVTQQKNELTYNRVEGEKVPGQNKSNLSSDDGTSDSSRNPLSPDPSPLLTITDVRSLQDSMKSSEKQFQNNEEILKMGCEVKSTYQVQNPSDCDNTDLEEADIQCTPSITTLKLNRSLSECNSESRITHQNNETKDSGVNDLASQSIVKRSISCDSNLVALGNKRSALEEIHSAEKKLGKQKLTPKSRGNNQQNKTEVSKSFLNFLSNLRRENLDKYRAIHFTHIKTLEKGGTMNTVGILEPSLMRNRNLHCVKCTQCQMYFSPHTFLLHIDTTTDKVAQESLQAEPWPTSKLTPEDEVIWKKFLHIKDYRVQLSAGSTSPSTNLTGTQCLPVPGTGSSSTQPVTPQITTKVMSQSDSSAIQQTASVSSNVVDVQPSRSIIQIISVHPPQDNLQNVVKETSGMVDRTQDNQSAVGVLLDTNVLQTKTTVDCSQSNIDLTSPDTQSGVREGNLVVPVLQHVPVQQQVKPLVVILSPEQSKEIHSVNPKPSPQHQTVQQLVSKDASPKQTVSKTVVAEQTVAASLAAQQISPSYVIAKLKTNLASRSLSSTLQVSEKSRTPIQLKTDSVTIKENPVINKQRSPLCRPSHPVSRQQTSVTNTQNPVNNVHRFDRGVVVQPALAIQSVGLMMNNAVASTPQQQQQSMSNPSQTGIVQNQQNLPVYLFPNNLTFPKPNLMLTNNTGFNAQNTVVVSSPFEEEDRFNPTKLQYRTANTMIPPTTPQTQCPPQIPGNQRVVTAQFQNNNSNTCRNPSGQYISSNQNSSLLNALHDSICVNNSSSGQQNSAITTSLVQQKSNVQPFNMNPLQPQEQMYQHQNNVKNRNISTTAQRESGKNLYFTSDQSKVMNQSPTVGKQAPQNDAFFLTQLKKSKETTQSTASSNQTITIQPFSHNLQGSLQPYNSQNLGNITKTIPNLNYQLPKQNIHQPQLPPFKPQDSRNVDIRTQTNLNQQLSNQNIQRSLSTCSTRDSPIVDIRTQTNLNHQLSNQNVQRSVPIYNTCDSPIVDRIQTLPNLNHQLSDQRSISTCNTHDSPNVDIRTQIIPNLNHQLSNQNIQRSLPSCNTHDSPNIDIRTQIISNLDNQTSIKNTRLPPPPYKPTVSQQVYQQSSQTVQENKQDKPYGSTSIEYGKQFTPNFNLQSSSENVQQSTPPYKPGDVCIIPSSGESSQSQFYSSLSPQQQKSVDQSKQPADGTSPGTCINLCLRDTTSVPDDIQAVRDLEMKESPIQKSLPIVENKSCSNYSTSHQHRRNETENVSCNIHEQSNSKETCSKTGDLSGNAKETRSETGIVSGNTEVENLKESNSGKDYISVNAQELVNLKENETKKIAEKETEKKGSEDYSKTTVENLQTKDGVSPKQSTSGSEIASLIKGPKDCLKVFSVAQNVMLQCLTWMSTELQGKSDEIEKLKQENAKQKSEMNQTLGRLELMEKTMTKKMMDVVDMFKK